MSSTPASSSNEASSSNTLSASSSTTQTATSDGGKVKQTRRRQRLSCVECTKRRQKCDRQFPCGLCTSRGIPHLCRWEPIVVRPPPQRPPIIATEPTADPNATIEALLARVAVLEKALLNENGGQRDLDDGPGSNILDSSIRSVHAGLIPDSRGSSVEQDEEGPRSTGGPRALLDYNVQLAAVALAQLSLAPRTEYVGAGTVLCALHKLGDPDPWRVPYPQSSTTTTTQVPSISKSATSNPVISPIRRLISQLPTRAHVEEMLDSFFAIRNGEFGISQLWFRTACQQMWYHLDLRCTSDCLSQGGCPACREEINPHWLSLLFAILAQSPSNRQKGLQYANHSLAARRIVDDILLSSPAYSATEDSVQGGVLSCMAAALLSAYLADRGRVSEAWKLCGTAIRNAQALGLHRDPRWRKWEAMGPVEKDLRMATWWLLAVGDRLLSYILGRPPMTIRGTFETMPWPPNTFGDGSPNRIVLFQRNFILLTDLMCEASITCLGLSDPIYSTVVEMDRKFQEWESQLPSILSWRNRASTPNPQPSGGPFDSSPDEADPMTYCPRFIESQRVVLAAWYLDTLMGIHRPYLMHPPPREPRSRPGSPLWYEINPSRERCIELAIELTSVLCQYHTKIAGQPLTERVLPIMLPYFIFDGAVALAGALSQVPPHPRASECLELMDNAMVALHEIADATKGAVDGEGETANRALKVLAALRRAGGWGLDEREKGELVSMMDFQEQNDTIVGVRIPPTTLSSHSSGFHVRGSESETEANFFRHHTTSAPFPTQLGSVPPHAASSTFWMNSIISNAPNSFGGTSSDISSSLASDFQQFSNTGGEPSLQSQIPGLVDFDMDWVRLAGMENWYSGGMTGGGSA
ncbi:unnamed protein product [Somion occarium]|uniref:Zn(2)-C6 fungal-type domain-containing protein n=1 Tax=Somion occarium TaxID=3059160 RepID=A0ABP1CR42_9APHY